MRFLTRSNLSAGTTAAAISSVLVTSAAVAAPTWPTSPTSPWKEVTATTDSLHLVNQASAGAIHTVCSAQGCTGFVQPAAGCMPGSIYPLLINSSRSVNVMPSRCVVVQLEGKPRLMAHMKDSTPLLKAMIAGLDITIGFPTQQGDVSVLTVRMPGASSLLASGIRRIGKVSGTAFSDPKKRARKMMASGTRIYDV